MSYGIIENNTIINVIECTSLSDAQTFFPNNEVIEIGESSIGTGSLGVDWFKENNEWYPPKPGSDYIWNAELLKWEKPL